MKRKRHFKNFIKGRRGERGATAVEFALLVPVFLMFVLGILDFGRLFFVKNTMQFAVGQAARYVMVNPTSTSATVIAYAENQGDSMFAGITYTADDPGTDTDVDTGVTYRTITATYTFTYLVPFVSFTSTPLSASVRTPVNE